MAHTKRYKRLKQELCEQAVKECFKGKWRRNDILTFIEKYAGIPRDDIRIDDLSGTRKYKNEAIKAIGLAMLGIVEDLVDYGIEPDDMEPVVIRQRPEDQRYCVAVHYAPATRAYHKADPGAADSSAAASNATRKHSRTRTDNAKRPDAAIPAERITRN